MVIVFTIALVVYPKQCVETGIAGLRLFWDAVFPSLFPFFILAELLLGLGIVRGFGVLLEPLMRPVFSVPGIGAFALSMGLAAGYPMDAVITSRFREQKLCTRVEGERLLAFTNTADPLFMFGAVAVGFFKSPVVGGVLAIAHYISAFLVGVAFKLWGRGSQEDEQPRPDIDHASRRGNIFVRAYHETLRAREEDGRPFGKLLGNAVTESIQTILMICGFIVFFAVLIEIIHLAGFMHIFAWPITLLYNLLGIHSGLVHPTVAGVLEIDIGSAKTAGVLDAPMIQKLAVVSAIIAWSGLSVHAQVASVLTNTDIRMSPYFLARFLHAILAAVITVILYRMGVGQATTTAFSNVLPVFATAHAVAAGAPWYSVLGTAFAAWGWCIGGLLVLSVVVYLLRRVRVIAFHAKMKKA
jgi:sporulation integral membrane protein YlbJ